MLDWLSPIDHLTQHREILQKHCEGTGAAFLGSNKVQGWINGEKQTLICTGIPGAGKSVLASCIIDRLHQTFLLDEAIGIAYVYCDFRQRYEQSIRDVLGSLVKQLALRRRVLPNVIDILSHIHTTTGRVPIVDLSRALKTVTESFSRVFIVIDALDELQLFDGTHAKIVSDTMQLQSQNKLNFLVTSRPIPNIVGLFGHAPSIEIKADPRDVEKYINGQMKLLSPFVLRHKQLQEEIRDRVTASTNGM